MASTSASKLMRIAMNGVTGRMGYRQHLVRSILQIREQGGVSLPDGTRVEVEPVLVGRDKDRLREIARRHQVERWSTDLPGVLKDSSIDIYFDAQVTSQRPAALKSCTR